MKLIDALKQRGKPFEIPDSSRNDLPQFLVEMDYQVGAEIGVFQGEFTEKLLKAGLYIYAVDPWVGYSGAGRTEKVQTKQDANFEATKTRLLPYPNCKLIRRTSMAAVVDFEAEGLDFVYLDGDHRFRYIAEDISEWFSKVKPGGVISGHDYFCTPPKANNVIRQVKPVVDAFVETYQIENFYTFGSTKEDRALSWMFLKP